VTGLTNGTNYTFAVIAFNAAGALVSSAFSAAVTPTDSSIASTTPGAANAAAANAAAALGSAVIPAGAPSAGAGGASQSGDSRLMGLGFLALLLSGAATVPAIRRRRRA